MLTGKTAIITGGSRGIGAAIAKKVAALGGNVAVIYAGREEAAKAVCEECESTYGVTAKYYCCNVADFNGVKEIVAQIKADFGGVQLLFNNAGITKDKLIIAMKEEDFDDVLDVNLKGAFNMIRHVAPLMIRAKEGAIVNISSVSGLMGNAGQANYSASKAGIVGLTKSTARELASRGITCNAIAPGFIETDMTKEINTEENALAAMIPLKRMGKPEEIADAAVFMAMAKYITGEVLRVDGGIAM